MKEDFAEWSYMAAVKGAKGHKIYFSDLSDAVGVNVSLEVTSDEL